MSDIPDISPKQPLPDGVREVLRALRALNRGDATKDDHRTLGGFVADVEILKDSVTAVAEIVVWLASDNEDDTEELRRMFRLPDEAEDTS